MLRLTRLFCVAALAAAAPALADDWQRSYNVSGTAVFSLDAADARITLEGWDRPAISVRVETPEGVGIGARSIEIDERQNGDAVTVRVLDRRPWSPVRITWKSTHVVVRLPRNARLDVRTGDGSCEAGGIDGDIHIESGDGAIHTDATGGRMRLETRDGRIIVRRGHGVLSAHTGDGRIEADGVFSGLDLSSGDGSILAQVDSGSAAAEDWSLRTSDGRIRLTLPRDFDADIEAHTSDGRIRFELPVRETMERRRAKVRLGAGGRAVLLRSGDGSITVSQD